MGVASALTGSLSAAPVSIPAVSSDPLSLTLVFTGLAVVVGGLVALWSLYQAVTISTERQLMRDLGIEVPEKTPAVERESWWSQQYRKWTDAVPLEKENDVMLDHSYDGIRELDNSLPPWWIALFYITIVAGVIYFAYYQVFDYGMSSSEEYIYAMEQAEEEVKAYRARQVNTVDENSVEMLEDPQQIALGGSIFATYCATCHGAAGEGGIGPNMTDPYWIHGGSIKDIFKTIKYGVPEKGMIAWQAQLRPVDMQRVAAYIMTLNGTDPPNAKEPQGEIYEPTITPLDTLAGNVLGQLE